MPATPKTPASKATTSKACDACRIRRTKCDRSHPCKRCSISNIACSYDMERRKRGPRGKTVTALQGILGKTEHTRPAIKLAHRASPGIELANGASPGIELADSALPGIELANSASTSQVSLTLTSSASPQSATSDNALALFIPPTAACSSTEQWLLQFMSPVNRPFGQPHHPRAEILLHIEDSLVHGVDNFFKFMYDLWPVVDLNAVTSRLQLKHHLHDEQFAAMVLSMTAMSLLLPGGDVESFNRADLLLREAMSMYNTPDLAANPNLETLSVTIIIASVLLITRGLKAHHLQMRRAFALTELLDLGNPKGYESFSASERELAVHIFWVMAGSARSNALLRTNGMPSNSTQIVTRGRLTHIRELIPGSATSVRLEPCTRLYEVVDSAMIDCIHGECTPRQCELDITSALVTHRILDSIEATPTLSMVQLADFTITRLWLHTQVWSACMTHSLLQPNAVLPELAIGYPVDILAQVADAIKRLHSDGIRGNGCTIGKKLLSVVAAANSVLNLPIPPGEFSLVESVAHGLELAAQVTLVGEALLEARWIRWEPYQAATVEAFA